MKPPMFRAIWAECNQKVQRGILPHCLGPMRHNLVLCPNWGSPVWGRHWYTGASPMEAMEAIGSWSTLCPRGGCWCWVCSAWEGMDLGDLTGIYRYPKQKKIWRQTSPRITVTGWQATIPSWNKTILMKVMYFFTVTVVKHWDRLTKEVVRTPYLEILKTLPEKVRSNPA